MIRLNIIAPLPVLAILAMLLIIALTWGIAGVGIFTASALAIYILR